MTIRTISTLALCAMLSTLGTAASASPKTGTLSGQVRDSHGKPIVHAQVKILQTGEVATTDSHGDYIFTDEDPGDYAFAVNADKFKMETLTATISANTTEILNFVLEPDIKHHFNTITIPNPSAKVIVKWYSGPKRSQPVQPDPQETFPGDLGLHSTARSR